MGREGVRWEGVRQVGGCQVSVNSGVHVYRIGCVRGWGGKVYCDSGRRVYRYGVGCGERVWSEVY